MIRKLILLLIVTLGMLVQSSAFAKDKSVVAKEWREYTDTLAPLGDHLAAQVPDVNDEQLRREFYSLMFAEIAAGYLGLLQADPVHPDFRPLLTQAYHNVGVPNPDNVYYITPIDDGGVYRVSGFRGTVRIVNFQMGTKSALARGVGGWGPTLANYDLDDGIHVDKDGAFEVLISAKRPSDYTGEWWPLLPGATYLMVRQCAYDWLHEIDARLAIERLDAPAAKPRATAKEIDANLKQISAWVQNFVTLTTNGPKKLKAQGLLNKVLVHDLSGIAGLTTQLYSDSLFDLAPDEAAIIEAEMPGQCRYWNQQLANEMWGSLDFMHRQTSINGYTARLDSDGKFRMVVSARDPGVPNWLDTLGYQRGVILGRWERCDKPPVMTFKKVKVAEVRQYLPADTPTVSAAEREASIRLRREGAQLRRRW